MDSIRISIIIPAYNEARTLQACLEAIAAQTVTPYEVIVVDNNSVDGTAAMASSYPFVRLAHEPRQGVVFARNKGFDMARGNIIARIDADVHLPPDWVAQVTGFYQRPNREKSVFTGGCRFYNLRTGYLTGRMYDLVVHRLNALLLGYYFPWGSNCALPVDAWRAVRASVLNRTDIHEDLDLGMHLRVAGYSTLYLPRVRVAAMAKRVLDHRSLLWPYAAMWPRTYRLNKKITWPLVWPLAVFVWLGGYWIVVVEKLAASLSINE